MAKIAIESLLSSPYDQAVEVMSIESFDEDALQAQIEQLGYQMVHLDGTKITTKDALLNELAQAMQFPAYFGKNWDALEECLRDLAWLPAKGYILLFSAPENFIKHSRLSFEIFLEIISSVSFYWARQAVRFLMILAVEKEEDVLEFG